MHLVNNDETQIGEQLYHIAVPIFQQCFERLRRSLHNSLRLFQRFAFLRLTCLAMPLPDRNVRVFQQFFEPHKLVIDQGFERTDVENADT